MFEYFADYIIIRIYEINFFLKGRYSNLLCGHGPKSQLLKSIYERCRISTENFSPY